MKVYFWDGEHHGPEHAGGWVAVTWAAAVDSLDELRRLCADAHVECPAKPYQSKPGRDEWEAAAARPGALLYRNLEPTGDEPDGWQAPDGGKPTGPALTEEETERRFSAWHDGAGKGLAAHEYLGWTWEEYARWAETAELPRRR